MMNNWINAVNWPKGGLVPVVTQDYSSNAILMVAWMNRKALIATVTSGEAVYWSRSRKRLWRKGEESGHIQKIKSIHLDCDEDCLLLTVEQIGGVACHTGRQSCFFNKLENDRWLVIAPVIKDLTEIYKK
ncbi:MAG: phosphoribosyl-AMP cyclohydrolase [Nitrosospira sp.]|nr:phosphoribosyl-AMP cyclohydrolase [Nitrosospira sp.]MDW7643188.1 phosphoribosyl-AMP cyclohydrolase [Nitrosomonadaceae bacterium]MBI0407423.1 phosphoribosyl-AMP cyclohydrolase [Nitrosospira sp.]MBI0414910.1 phosphoribosyl-AMP cyclohydrolase [Nitrosospira sp.]MBI0417490.1 phosphoribosyl-AMP cyclohydrolase [Nitrosospira sp.]